MLIGPIRGSPFTATFVRNVPKANNKMNGPLFISKLVEDVNELVAFSSQALEQLRKPVAESDMDALLRVKEMIASVAAKDAGVMLVIDRTWAAISWLQEKEGAQVGAGLDAKIALALETWERVKKQVPVTKGNILPLSKVYGLETRFKIAAFENKINEYRESVTGAPFWKYSVGVEAARNALDEAAARQEVMRQECNKVEHVANVFEIGDMVSLLRPLAPP